MIDDTPPLDLDLSYDAWAIIANVSEGDWSRQTEEWRNAAIRWRDRFHAGIEHIGAVHELVVPHRRTGVIVGTTVSVSMAQADEMRHDLEERFPHVTFAIASHSNSIAFEWDEPEDES